MEPLTWHIGNLTIFGKKANRKAGNDEFAEKKVRYAQSKVVMTQDVAASYNLWDENSIADDKKVAEIALYSGIAIPINELTT